MTISASIVITHQDSVVPDRVNRALLTGGTVTSRPDAVVLGKLASATTEPTAPGRICQ